MAGVNLITSTEQSQNLYTAPQKLHHNLFVGALQLLFWLLFHPSAWRNHIASIDPNLAANFTLGDLNKNQWHNPSLRRLLGQGLILWPLFMGLIVWLTGVAEASYTRAGPRGVVAAILFAIAINLILSLAGGLMVSVPMGIVSGVTGSLAYSLASLWPADPSRTVALVIAMGLALGIAGSVAYDISNRDINRRTAYSARRRVAGLTLGMLIGLIGPLVVISFAIQATGSELISLLFADVVVGGVQGISLLPSIILGVISGIALSIAAGRRIPLLYGILLGLVFGLAYGPARLIGFYLMPQLAGVGNVALLAILFAFCYGVTERLAGSQIGIVAGVVGGGTGFIIGVIGNAPWWPLLPSGILCLVVGLTLPWWRPILFYPFATFWNLILYRLDERRSRHLPSFFRWHSVFWDEYQRLPLAGLDDYLLLELKQNPIKGQATLDYLITTPQRWAAQAAQIELDAYSLEACTDVESVGQAHHTITTGDLTGPASALLRSFSRLSQDTAAGLQQGSIYNQRLALSTVEERLDSLLRELTRSSEPYAERFRAVARHWRRLVADHIADLIEMVEIRQEIDNPYIIGVPLTEQQEIFVGRTGISARIEQLLRDKRRPPLFLYGQRRMGKTSLLNNLGRLLPTTVVPLFVDLQGASRASDQAGLLYNIARDMGKSAAQRRGLNLPELRHETLATDPFTCFETWLDDIEQVLEDQGGATALLALDEFETLDNALCKGRYDAADVMGTLRHLIQHRPRFKVLLAGSHALEEFQRWASYLINVQVIAISYLSKEETLRLVEKPVEGFMLRYEKEAARRVWNLTRGHPFLIQLLCAEIVALKNEQPPEQRRLATLADVEIAVPASLTSGSFFFADIQRNQTNADGLIILQTLAIEGETQPLTHEALSHNPNLSGISDFDTALSHLLQRELIEATEQGYRIQVELIRRWFARE